MLRKVPSWLTDPLGPLAVRPAYLPKATPWLARWIRAGRMDRVHAISDAMAPLHRGAFDTWRGLLGAGDFAGLFRRGGQVQLWDEVEETPGAALERALRERHGIDAQVLGQDEIRQIFPGITRHVSRGVLIPGNGHTVSPPRAVRRLGELFLEAGGRILPQRAMKLIPDGSGGWTVMTNTDNLRAGQVVVAGGAWSRQLLDPLGIPVPLETERGYHLMLPSPGIEPRLPILYKSRNFGVTPMEEGLRVAGTVEIAGLDAAPDERRAERLMGHLRNLFPEVSGGEPRLWMGFRPSTPDSLPVLGTVPGHPGLHLCFGHGHFGMTGGPPSGALVAGMILGQHPGIDVAPYSVTRFR
jgi:D-amino-acid dehydrogenase